MIEQCITVRRMFAGNGTQVAEGSYTQTLKRGTDMEDATNIPNEEQTGRLQQPAVTCRASVLWFAEQMELALRRNDHKGGWEAMGQEVIAARCGEELEELRQCWDRTTGKQVRSSSDIIAEAADVANFAMMVADLSGPKHGM